METILDRGFMLNTNPTSGQCESITVDGVTFHFHDGIGPLLRFVRINADTAIENIAAAVEKSMNFIYQIERGERKASPQLLRELSLHYGIPNHYSLLIMMEGIITSDEYIAIKGAQYNKDFNKVEAVPIIDLVALLKNNRCTVLYEEKELNEAERNQIIGALKIVMK